MMGISCRTAFPKIRVAPSQTEAKTPAHGVPAPSFREAIDRTIECAPGELPPTPARMPAAPAMRNSLSWSISTPVASTRPSVMINMLSTMSIVTPISVDIWVSTTLQSTSPKSPGPNAGQRPVPPTPDHSRPADWADSTEMPET